MKPVPVTRPRVWLERRHQRRAKNGARYYSPTEGRWTQHDTLDQPLNPANANRYAYAADNPVNYVDPRGALTVGAVAGGAVGTVLGFVGVGVACGTTLGVGCAVAAGIGVGAAAGALGGGVQARLDDTDLVSGLTDGAALGAVTGGLGGTSVGLIVKGAHAA